MAVKLVKDIRVMKNGEWMSLDGVNMAGNGRFTPFRGMFWDGVWNIVGMKPKGFTLFTSAHTIVDFEEGYALQGNYVSVNKLDVDSWDRIWWN